MYSHLLPNLNQGALLSSEYRPISGEEIDRVLLSGPFDCAPLPEWVARNLIESFPLRSFTRVMPLNILVPEVRTKTEYIVFLHLQKLGMLRDKSYQIHTRDYMEIAGRFETYEDGTAYYKWMGESSEFHIDSPLLINLAASGFALENMVELPVPPYITTGYHNVQQPPGDVTSEVEVVSDGDAVPQEYPVTPPPNPDLREGLPGDPASEFNKGPLSPMEEAVDWRNIDVSKAKSKVTVQDEFEAYLTSYIQHAPNQAKIPLLIGNTAVAKSALVKSVVKDLDNKKDNGWGYRLVDFRCAFVDKSDVEGFVDPQIDPVTGEKRSFQSPMRELTICTDGFIEYCRNVVQDVNRQLQDPDIDDDTKAGLIRLRDGAPDKEGKKTEPGMAHYAKTPVLFFDEVTRSTKAIRNVFTTILNSKTLENYDMRYCRMVAATNEPVGLHPTLGAIYQTEEMDDAANMERFEPFIVTQEKVFPRWKEHINGTYTGEPWHPLVVEFIGENAGRAYNIMELQAKILDKNSELKADDARHTPFANFRTWEFVNDYLSSCNAGEPDSAPVSRQFILKTIGDFPNTHTFLAFLQSKGVKFEEDLVDQNDYDEFTAAIEASLKSGVPLLMAAPSSYGKTSRIEAVREKYNAVIVKVNLAAKDRTQIKGAPAPALMDEDIFRAIPGKVSEKYKNWIGATNSEFDPETQSESPDKLRFNFPAKYTDFYPQNSIREQVLDAKRNGKLCILFFDEVNRADPLVLSAVFEAVSDYRFMGVQFEPGQVVVMAACNIGESYGDVTELDPAFAARFAVYKKDQYDDKDARSFINLMKKKKWDEVIISWFENLTPKEIVDVLSDVENRTLQANSSSSRSFEDLNEFLKACPANHFMRGKAVIGPDQQQAVPRYTTIEAFNGFPKSWIGFGATDKDKITVNGSGYPVKEVYDTLFELKQEYDAVMKGDKTGDAYQLDVAFNYYLGSLKDMEEKLLSRRGELLKAKVGESPKALEFVEWYQSHMGNTTAVRVEDLMDPDNVDSFIESFSDMITNDLDGVHRITKVLGDFISVHGNGDAVHVPFAKLVTGILNEANKVSGGSGDVCVTIVNHSDGLFGIPEIAGLLCDIFSTPSSTAQDLSVNMLTLCGIPLLQSDLDQMTAYYKE